MQDQADIQVTGHGRVRSLSLQHPQEIGGMVEGIVGWHHRLIVAYSMPGRHQSRHPGHQGDGAAQTGRPVACRDVVVGHGKQGHAGLEHVHGAGLPGPETQAGQHKLGHLPRRPHPGHEFAQLRRGRQGAMEQQIGGFQVGGAVGQVLDPVAPVDQDALFAVDETDARIRHGDSAQAGVFDADLVAHCASRRLLCGASHVARLVVPPIAPVRVLPAVVRPAGRSPPARLSDRLRAGPAPFRPVSATSHWLRTAAPRPAGRPRRPCRRSPRW